MSDDKLVKSAIGKHIDLVLPTLKHMNINFRLIRRNGLITADFVPYRWDILVSEDGVIEDINIPKE